MGHWLDEQPDGVMAARVTITVYADREKLAKATGQSESEIERRFAEAMRDSTEVRRLFFNKVLPDVEVPPGSVDLLIETQAPEVQ